MESVDDGAKALDIANVTVSKITTTSISSLIDEMMISCYFLIEVTMTK